MPPWFSEFEDPLDSELQDHLDSELQQQLPTEYLANQDEEFVGHEANQIGSPAPRSDTKSRSVSESASESQTLAFKDAPDQYSKKFEVRIPTSTLVTPRGKFDGWIPPAPRTRERIALSSIMEHLESQEGLVNEDFIEFDLVKFSVYVETSRYPCELRPLQHLSTKGPDEFYFDGVLSLGELKFYVERVPFNELPIGNYGTAHDSIDDQIWIRSHLNAKREVYYKLKTPATEYQRFHTPFLWIADLAKHVADYCEHMAENNKAVSLRHFQQRFYNWLKKIHKTSSTFRHWRDAHGSDDFRAAITANVEFIWKEVYGLLGARVANSLQLFKEVKHLSQYQPFAAVLGDKRNPVQPSTIVTPYVYKCFGLSEFGSLLEPLGPLDEDGDSNMAICDSNTAAETRNKPDFKTAEQVEQDELDVLEEIEDVLDPPRIAAIPKKQSEAPGRKQSVNNIKVGQVISTPPDGVGTGTKWKQELAKGTTADHRWFGLVQRVHVSPKTRARSFDVTWLYRPVDTPCGKMVYPWSKELFLSNHCTCEEGRDARVEAEEVLGVHSVDWFGSPETSTADFFVRQTYQVEQRRWVALEKGHMTCDHDKPDRLEYKRGDTVLASCSRKEDRADVYEVVKVFKQGDNRFARLRRLLRRNELERHLRGTGTRPNELVYTDQTVVMKPQRILGRCLVRFFEATEPIPCPYDRNGTANVFFITHKLLQDGTCVPLADYNRPTTLRQGLDPKRRVPKLQGLDLFCGSGNFGRGLEEGGAVSMRWANDIWTEAIHSYMVNAPQHTKPFLGSVDDLLRYAIEGRQGIPRRGDVDFISGGSPCQGFSLITSDKTSDRQKKNRSLVASFASFVDFYRPKYGILENVLNIVQTGRNRDEDAFSQLICAIVGMGYQTQLTLGDAWTYGAPQSRSRAFLYFSSPGQRLPGPPRPSHSHFDGVKSRGLGRMTNGESFVSRSFDPTPFEFVSTAQAAADLPEIHDAKPDYCIGFPDHRISIGATTRSRHQYHRIPTHPYGMSFVKAWQNGNGVMTRSERELFPASGHRVEKLSQGWGRVKPNSVFHTITTGVNVTDARAGRFLHWYEDRPITILEARRAQGFLDHEVLVGSPSAQYELVGNSVARLMALALGLQFREAWLGSLYDDRTPVSADAQTNAGLVELPMADIQDEAIHSPEGEGELDSEDDEGDSLFVTEGAVPKGVRLTDTPPTSLSGSEVRDLISAAISRKRALSESLAVDMHASKTQKVDAGEVRSSVDVWESGDVGEQTALATNADAVTDFSAAVVVETQQSSFADDGRQHGSTAASAALVNETLCGRVGGRPDSHWRRGRRRSRDSGGAVINLYGDRRDGGLIGLGSCDLGILG